VRSNRREATWTLYGVDDEILGLTRTPRRGLGRGEQCEHCTVIVHWTTKEITIYLFDCRDLMKSLVHKYLISTELSMFLRIHILIMSSPRAVRLPDESFQWEEKSRTELEDDARQEKADSTSQTDPGADEDHIGPVSSWTSTFSVLTTRQHFPPQTCKSAQLVSTPQMGYHFPPLAGRARHSHVGSDDGASVVCYWRRRAHRARGNRPRAVNLRAGSDARCLSGRAAERSVRPPTRLDHWWNLVYPLEYRVRVRKK